MNKDELENGFAEALSLADAIEMALLDCERVCENNSESIGPLLRRLREARGIKQFEMSKALHMSQPYLSDLERGKRRWRKSTVVEYLSHIDHNILTKQQ